MKSMLVLTLAAAIGCQQNPSKLDSTTAGAAAKPVTTEGQGASTGTTPAADLPKDAEGRLARVERRLDKVITILEQALPPSEPDPMMTYSVAVDPIDPIEGPKDAKVTIVEGFEFLCPYCFMVNPTVEQIIAKYPKDVRVVSKYLIIHGQPAIAPGMAACAAAKQGKYREMKAALWTHLFKLEEGRPKIQSDQVSVDNIDKIATEAHVDIAKMKLDMQVCQGWLRASQEALHPVGVNATPAFFVNGRPVSGAQPFDAFDKLIQEELAKADKAIADGVKQADYYDTVVVAKGEHKVKGRYED